MNKNNYDIYRINIKKREDTNSLVVLVEYYKDGRVIEQKRTTNPELIMRILKTAANTSKNIDYLKKNLVAEYYNNGIITIENYDEIKSAPEFNFFNKKVEKSIKKEKKQKEKSASSLKPEKEVALSSIKNLKVTRDTSKLNKVKKLTFKLVPLATLSVIVMTQIIPIVRNLPTFNLNDKKVTMDMEQKIPDFTEETFSIGNTKITLPELYSNLSNDQQQIASKKLVKEKSLDNETIVSEVDVNKMNQDILKNETSQNNTENLNSQVEKESILEEIVNGLQDKIQEISTVIETPLQEPENQSSASFEVEENIQVDPSMDSVTPVMENIEEPIITSNEQEENLIQEPTVDEIIESNNQSISLSEIEEVSPIVTVTDSKNSEVENIEEPIITSNEQEKNLIQEPNVDETIESNNQPISLSEIEEVSPMVTEIESKNSEVKNKEELVTTVNEQDESKIKEPSVDEVNSLESNNQPISLSEIEEVSPIVNETDSKSSEVENIEEPIITSNEQEENLIQEIANINTISNHELSSYASTVSSEFPIFKSKSYIDNITEEQLYKMAAVIAGEDSYTYEGSLAAISTVLNRCDTDKYQEYGGDNPYAQLFYPSQFVAKDASLSKRYMNHPEEIPDFVIAAVTDGLNGYRNHTYTSFRAGNGNDRVRIGENGNYYFNSSSEVANYGYVANTNKTI